MGMGREPEIEGGERERETETETETDRQTDRGEKRGERQRDMGEFLLLLL